MYVVPYNIKACNVTVNTVKLSLLVEYRRGPISCCLSPNPLPAKQLSIQLIVGPSQCLDEETNH